MKAITLWQPWASLVACGAKRIETRSWGPPNNLVGQRVTIHAAKKRLSLREVDRLWPVIKRAVGILRQNCSDQFLWDDVMDSLPYGCIVATAKLQAVAITDFIDPPEPGTDEALFGDYSPGRFAWKFREISRLLEPYPWKGGQRIWNLPDEGCHAAAARMRLADSHG